MSLATISSSAPTRFAWHGHWNNQCLCSLSTTAQLTLSSVAPGISEALVATAVGLLAALPALIGDNQLTRKLENILNGSLAFAEELIAKSLRN